MDTFKKRGCINVQCGRRWTFAETSNEFFAWKLLAAYENVHGLFLQRAGVKVDRKFLDFAP